jgi:hypothetical protein
MDLSEEPTSTIKGTIPNQRSQPEAKLGGKGPPDPGAPQASASALLREKRASERIAPRGFWCFF